MAYVNREGNRRYEGALLSILTKHGYHGNLDELASTLADTYRNSTKGEMKNLHEFWEYFLKKLNINAHFELLKGLGEVRNRYLSGMFRLYESSLETLSVLRNKYKLALVSNCSVGTIDIMKDLKLTDYFVHVILSYEVGVRKPDRRIYLQALKNLDLKPDECIFVADEISDLEGAKAVGLKTILVRQGPLTSNEAEDPNFKPDYQCNHISEITKFL